MCARAGGRDHGTHRRTTKYGCKPSAFTLSKPAVSSRQYCRVTVTQLYDKWQIICSRRCTPTPRVTATASPAQPTETLAPPYTRVRTSARASGLSFRASTAFTNTSLTTTV